jgi:formylglycine-generating enzyme required for sulfatase activity
VKKLSNGESIKFMQIEKQTVPVGFGLHPRDVKFFSLQVEKIPLNHSFYVSSKEVRASLFYKYIRTLPEDDPSRVYFENLAIKNKLDEDLPIYDVNWFESVKFCNWLSEQEDRSPAYLWDAENSKWIIAPATNGYRLATNLEWDAANRAGTESRYFFGSNSRRMNRYSFLGNEFPYDSIAVSFRGKKMPNENGLFDMMGNTSEWCQDHNPGKDYGTQHRSSRGGQAMASLRWLSSAAVFDSMPGWRTTQPGIRLVLDFK